MRFNDKVDIDYIGFYDASAAGYTERANHANFDIFEDDAVVGDWFEFRAAANSMNRDIVMVIDVPLAADAITLEWAYKDRGGAWHVFTPTDGTTNFTASGTISWDFWDIADDWTTLTIRAKITALTNLTEGGHGTDCDIGDAIIYVENGNTVSFRDIETTDAANGWNALRTAPEDNAWTIPNPAMLKQYVSYAGIRIEAGGEIDDDGGNVLLLVSGGKDVVMSFYIEAGATLDLGAIDGQGHGYKGVNLLTDYYGSTSSYFHLYNYGTCKMYGSSFSVGSAPMKGRFHLYGTIDMQDTWLKGGDKSVFGPAVITATDDFTIRSLARMELIPAGTYTDVHFDELTTQFGPIRASNTWVDCSFSNVYWYNDRADHTFIFTDGIASFSRVNMGTDNALYRKWTCNIHVHDNAYANLAGVVITCKDKDGNNEWGVVATDANGNIAEQQIIQYQFIGGDDFPAGSGGDEDSRTPHTISFIKAGYRTVNIKLTVDHPIDWDIEMVPGDTVLYDSTIYDSTIY